MKTYTSQKQIESDIVNGTLFVNESVRFDVSFSIDANIKVLGNIDALNIDAWNIDARDIDAQNIDAYNIDAQNIDAWDIAFFAVAFAYSTFKCKSIAGRRTNNKYFCLDSEVEITG